MKARPVGLAVVVLVAAAVLSWVAVGNAAVGTPDVTILLNNMVVPGSGLIGGEVAFTVPYPQRATIQPQVTSQPSGLTYRMYFYPVGVCPAMHIKVGPHCYPTDGFETGYEFTEQVLRDNGASWKARAAVSGPAGPYQLSGRITVSFVPLATVASITVSSPKQGDAVFSDAFVNIAWTAKGQMARMVKITVVPEMEPQAAQVIIASTPNDGSHTWRPGQSVIGQAHLEIETLDGNVKGRSGVFTVQRR